MLRPLKFYINRLKPDEMERRFVSIWFHHLATDWFTRREPELRKFPFVLRELSRGRMQIVATNYEAEKNGIVAGTILADARAVVPDLIVRDHPPERIENALKKLAEWCIRFSPIVATDPPDGILLEASGCSHLWGGDDLYVKDIVRRFERMGYGVSVSMADTAGAAWAIARFGKANKVVPTGLHTEALLTLPPEALRLEPEICHRLHQLGLHQIRQFINISRASLRKRFGASIILQLDLARGTQLEILNPIRPAQQFEERLPCMEPIVTATGIRIALQQLVTAMCLRLLQEQKGLRKAILKCHRVDNKIVQIEIGTNRPTHDVLHILKLFENSIASIEPALGIELFILEAPVVEQHLPQQEKMWESEGGLDDKRLAELLDRIVGKTGNTIHRYLPEDSYWPERSIKEASTLAEPVTTAWRIDKLRPLHLLPQPERIDVSAPIPDYPPMLFRWKDKVHKIMKSDGPERIEQEWWIRQGQHRDYYRVEDEDGCRYWIFRSGHYSDKVFQWFLHGFFA
jgi:protein ImuB